MSARLRTIATLIPALLLAPTIAAQQTVPAAAPPPPPPAPQVTIQGNITLPTGGFGNVVVSGAGDNIEALQEKLQTAITTVQGDFLNAVQVGGTFQNPSMRTGTSRIAGRITGSNGQPLRQATVRVNVVSSVGTKSTETDADGRYELRDLPAGLFSVSASKSGFIGLSYGQTRPTEAPRSVELAENRSAERIDIVLPRGGAIAGRLVDEYGEPVADAQIFPMQKRYVQGQMRPMMTGRTAMTNDIGEFRIYGLSPGQYFVSARARAQMNSFDSNVEARNGYAATYYPGTANFADAQPVTVGVGETVSGVELALLPVRLASVSGIVIDSQGTPVPRGNVMAMELNGAGGPAQNGPIRPDGTFTISGLAPGDYMIRANAAMVFGGGPTEPGAGTVRYVQHGPPEPLVAAVTVNGSDISSVVVAPISKVNVSGRVTFDGGTPPRGFRGISVRLMVSPLSPAAGALPLGPPTQVREDFTFEFTVPAVELGLRAMVTGDLVVKAIRVRGADITDTGIDLRGARDLDGVEVQLTSRPPELTGVVTNDRGQPLSAATVLVFPQDRKQWIPDSRYIVSVRPSGADGRFSVRTLPAGRYLAVALEHVQPMAPQDPEFLESLRARGMPLTLADGQTTTLELKTLVGR